MQVHIKMPSGMVKTLDVEGTLTAGGLRRLIWVQFKIPAHKQRLTFQDKELTGRIKLCNAGVKHGHARKFSPCHFLATFGFIVG